MSDEDIQEAKAPLPGEPNVYTGGKQELGGIIPPYEGRQTDGSSPHEQGGQGAASGPREISDVEREGVSDTDTTAATPLGAGVSKTKQGNERMYGRSEEAQRADRYDIGVGGEPKAPHED